MADHEGQQPGTKGRLIREGVQQHRNLTAEQLTELLRKENPGLGIEFRVEEIRKAQELFHDEPPPADDLKGYEPLFTDRIPPVREGQPIQQTPPARSEPDKT